MLVRQSEGPELEAVSMIKPAGWLFRSSISLAVLAVAACGGSPTQPDDSPRATIVVSKGQEFEINLGTVGPGSYDSIPSISTAAVRFLDAAIVGPYVPAGERQRFRFVAQSLGVAVIVFHHSDSAPIVTDTVRVR